ncbi:MAG: nuclear transport factor 2 family protein [Halioglobus sp.]
MSNLQRFTEYAEAFEETLLDDDWVRLEQYFSPDAVYLPGDGNEATGRESVLQTLRDSVNSLDRKFDSREFAEEPIVTEVGDTVTFAFKVKYTKDGLPDLMIFGTERASFANGVIERMEDFLDEHAAAEMADWLEKHQQSLG